MWNGHFKLRLYYRCQLDDGSPKSSNQPTGVTRGKRRVVLVGQKKAVAIAVRNLSGRRRGRSWASGGIPALLSQQSGMAG